jgi:HEAT repeat protein
VPVLRTFQDQQHLHGAAGEALARIGEVDAGLEMLQHGLRSRDERTRLHYVGRFADLAATLPEAMPPLLRMLGDRSSAVRRQTAQAAARHASATSDPALFVPALLPALCDPDSAVRADAVAALAKLRTGPEVFPALAVCCRDACPTVRRAAIRPACARAPTPGEAIALVHLLLDDPNDQVRDEAALAVLTLGPAAASLAPDLFARGPNRGVRLSWQFFSEAGPLSAWQIDVLSPALRELLRHPNNSFRLEAARLLRRGGPRCDEILRAALADPNIGAREAAAVGLSLPREP